MKLFLNIFKKKIIELEKELQEKAPKIDLWIAHSKMVLTVRFRMVNPEITYKYSVDNERIFVPIDNEKLIYQERSFFHVYFMHSMGHTKADELIKDTREACEDNWNKAFPIRDGEEDNPGKIETIPVSKN